MQASWSQMQIVDLSEWSIRVCLLCVQRKWENTGDTRRQCWCSRAGDTSQRSSDRHPGTQIRHGEVARSSTRRQRRPAPISILEWWMETVYRLLVLAYCKERCWVNLLFTIATWISTSFNSCAQWCVHTYKQFLSMSVGLGLVFVHLFRFSIFWIFLV